MSWPSSSYDRPCEGEETDRHQDGENTAISNKEINEGQTLSHPHLPHFGPDIFGRRG